MMTSRALTVRSAHHTLRRLPLPQQHMMFPAHHTHSSSISMWRRHGWATITRPFSSSSSSWEHARASRAEDIHRNCGYEQHRQRERREEQHRQREQEQEQPQPQQPQQPQQKQGGHTATTNTSAAPSFSGAETIDVSQVSAEERARYLRVLMPEQCSQWSPEIYQLGLRIGGRLTALQKDLFFTLFALNGEIAHIKDATKNPSTGMIRMEWWRDGVKAALRGAQCPRTPVLIALASINQNIREENAKAGGTYKEVRFSDLREVFKWRETDLQWKQPATYDMMEKYAEGVYSHLLYALLKLVYADVGARTDSVNDSSQEKQEKESMSSSRMRMEMEMETDHIASHIGKSFGLVQMLRGTPVHARSQSTYLPADLCAQSDVTEDMIYRQARAHMTGKSEKGQHQYEVDPDELKRISNVVYHIADYAYAHLDHARKLSLDKVPQEALPLFYMSTMCDIYLDRLQKVNFNVFHPSLSADSLRMRYLFKLVTKPWWPGKSKF